MDKGVVSVLLNAVYGVQIHGKHKNNIITGHCENELEKNHEVCVYDADTLTEVLVGASDMICLQQCFCFTDLTVKSYSERVTFMIKVFYGGPSEQAKGPCCVCYTGSQVFRGGGRSGARMFMEPLTDREIGRQLMIQSAFSNNSCVHGRSFHR